MQNAEKVSVTMTPEMMRALRDSVAAGEFATTSEAMRDAVRVWHRQRMQDAERLDAIRARVRRSMDDPRPDLGAADADAHFEAMLAAAEKDSGGGPA